MKVNISAVIITYNEEANIDRCLSSLQNIADEIIIVDSFSQDKTKTICERYNVKFIEHAFEGHIQQKNFAMKQAKHDYILSLDGDEALTNTLREEILNVKNNWKHHGYAFNRLNNYCGQWIKHGGWYPDRKIRLWDRGKGYWGGVNPHDRVVMAPDATIGRLSGDLLHYSFSSLAEHVTQINYFSDITAREYYKAGKKSVLFFHTFINPTFTFFRAYIFQLGILDGFNGFIISVIMAYGNFLKYAKLSVLQKEQPVELNDYASVNSKRSLRNWYHSKAES
jgi:glycosyltransferase involved in cell wall biosynthesis